MTGWADACVWEGDGLRREVFLFPSRGGELYGSLYAAAARSSPIGIVACASWGTEADRSDAMVRTIALAAAQRGGAALVFHYPGYGDSEGDLATVGLDDLSAAAAAAVAEARRRRPGLTWILAGFMFGAAISLLAQRPAAVRRLLLVEPVLRPGAHMRWLADSSKRNPLRHAQAEGMAYGYPLPPRILDHAAAADAAAAAALAAFEGEAVAIYQAGPGPAGAATLPQRFERIQAPGDWRFGARAYPQLTEAAIDWLDSHLREPAGAAA